MIGTCLDVGREASDHDLGISRRDDVVDQSVAATVSEVLLGVTEAPELADVVGSAEEPAHLQLARLTPRRDDVRFDQNALFDDEQRVGAESRGASAVCFTGTRNVWAPSVRVAAILIIVGP